MRSNRSFDRILRFAGIMSRLTMVGLKSPHAIWLRSLAIFPQKGAAETEGVAAREGCSSQKRKAGFQ
ncbi:MAG TPA: hypothetical protein PKE02_05710 [Methyloceanibacter sp.]|nr:hypothetical protein [Methyloceanibacter sp.]